jgi:hypothetical protein
LEDQKSVFLFIAYGRIEAAYNEIFNELPELKGREIIKPSLNPFIKSNSKMTTYDYF